LGNPEHTPRLRSTSYRLYPTTVDRPRDRDDARRRELEHLDGLVANGVGDGHDPRCSPHEPAVKDSRRASQPRRGRSDPPVHDGPRAPWDGERRILERLAPVGLNDVRLPVANDPA